MVNNFKQTVDLKEQFNKGRAKAATPNQIKKEKVVSKPVKEKPSTSSGQAKKKAQAIDKVYRDEEIEAQEELQTISQPIIRNVDKPIIKRAILISIALAIILGAYWYFFNFRETGQPTTAVTADTGWYAVKLLNDEIYYGQIENKSTDPIIISNVYYNYDQLNKNEDEVNETGNLRLVKRGKETHGPAGSMSIVRAQVVYMEPLKEDSKVLKAILDYEN